MKYYGEAKENTVLLPLDIVIFIGFESAKVLLSNDNIGEYLEIYLI